MPTPTLPLSNLVDVTIQVSPQAVAPPQFNQAIVVGTSGRIPTYGTGGRCIQFSGGTTILQQMLNYGFSTSDPEYLAATQYLDQSPTPYYLWIGVQDLTAIGTFTIAVAGTNYIVGDLVTVVQSGGSNAILKVSAINTGTGAVTALAYVQQGTGYTVATDVPCSGGTGTGLEINITALGETPVESITACRATSPTWYLFNVLGANFTDSQCQALAEWAQTAAPVAQCFFSVDSTAVLNGATNNVFANLTAGNYNRFQGVYTTTQSGAAPNNTYMAAALMGLAMGLNTGLANSYFTLTNKVLVGMTPEPISQLQYNTITNNNGNVYASFGGSFDSYGPGLTGSGQYFDQILGLDMLAADLQFSLTNVLYQYNSIPQTDPGQAILLHAANSGCQPSVTRGFLAGGTWTGATILNLTAGTAVPNGYLNQSPSYASLGQKPPKRQSAPIYCTVLLAEAVQQVVIAVLVQQ